MTAIIIQASYFIASVLFILGLKGMSSPRTARRGIIHAGVGMLLAAAVTFAWPDMNNYGLIIAGLVIGAGAAWWAGRKIRMTAMPQMVAIYNGMGGGAAAAIAAIELSRKAGPDFVSTSTAAAGALIGMLSFSGSCIAFLKLQGIMQKTLHLYMHNLVNGILTVLTLAAGILVVSSTNGTALPLISFFVLAFVLGVTITVPVGGADMPVMISLYNAFTGLAVGLEGFVLNNPLLVIAGIVVGAAGTLLTRLMAKAMNRSLVNILFRPITGEPLAGRADVSGNLKEISAQDAAYTLLYSRKVIIVPGYGMAVGQAQYKVKELMDLLDAAGVEVKSAIHPVAGRMPGHMNVLLAEAGVSYENIFDLEDINNEFAQSDTALIIGANDVVNPSARTDRSSPIYGMPILNADRAKNVIVIKRGRGTGYSGIDNPLFYAANTRMLYGSAQQVVNEVIKNLKELSA